MNNTIKYDFSESRAFPYVDLEVSNICVENYKLITGKIDTGSNLTVIPEYLITSLDLKSTHEIPASGFDSDTKKYKAYVVNIKINNTEYRFVQVIASLKPRFNILLGRNLINLWKMELDGQSHTGVYAAWSTNTRAAT